MSDLNGKSKKSSVHPYRLILRKFITNKSGATAVEFALVAMPFLLLLFAILEVALVFFGSLVMDHAVDKTARLIRTGQAQTAGMSESQFKNDVCQQMISLFNCTNNLQVELITFTSFQNASNYLTNASNDPINGDGNLRDDFTFNADSQAEEIVLLRVFFEWDLTVKFPGVGLGNMDNGNRLLSTTATFKNEPFS